MNGVDESIECPCYGSPIFSLRKLICKRISRFHVSHIPETGAVLPTATPNDDLENRPLSARSNCSIYSQNSKQHTVDDEEKKLENRLFSHINTELDRTLCDVSSMEIKNDNIWLSDEEYKQYRIFHKKQFDPIPSIPITVICLLGMINRGGLQYVGTDNPHYLYSTAFIFYFAVVIPLFLFILAEFIFYNWKSEEDKNTKIYDNVFV